jgi:hypothetical protein
MIAAGRGILNSMTKSIIISCTDLVIYSLEVILIVYDLVSGRSLARFSLPCNVIDLVEEKRPFTFRPKADRRLELRHGPV